jgi:hypothetical protein
VPYDTPSQLILSSPSASRRGFVIAGDADRVHVPDELAGFVEAIEPDRAIVFPQLVELLLGLRKQRAVRSDHRH